MVSTKKTSQTGPSEVTQSKPRKTRNGQMETRPLQVAPFFLPDQSRPTRGCEVTQQSRAETWIPTLLTTQRLQGGGGGSHVYIYRPRKKSPLSDIRGVCQAVHTPAPPAWPPWAPLPEHGLRTLHSCLPQRAQAVGAGTTSWRHLGHCSLPPREEVPGNRASLLAPWRPTREERMFGQPQQAKEG